MIEIILGAAAALAAVGGWYSFRSAQREEELNGTGRAATPTHFSSHPSRVNSWGTATAASLGGRKQQHPIGATGKTPPTKKATLAFTADRNQVPPVITILSSHQTYQPWPMTWAATPIDFHWPGPESNRKKANVDEAAIAHYGEVIDACLASGVTPWSPYTTSHTQAGLRKGFLRKGRNIAYFERFAEVVFKAYSDRVVYWCTHNECGPFATMGWGLGISARQELPQAGGPGSAQPHALSQPSVPPPEITPQR